MRKFTPEEKELIVNTPINRDCFDNCERMTGWVKDDRTIFIVDQPEDYYFRFLDAIRLEYKSCGRKGMFEKLVSLLPSCYKVVKL